MRPNNCRSQCLRPPRYAVTGLVRKERNIESMMTRRVGIATKWPARVAKARKVTAPPKPVTAETVEPKNAHAHSTRSWSGVSPCIRGDDETHAKLAPYRALVDHDSSETPTATPTQHPKPHTQILKLLRMASRVTPAMMVATCVANILRAVGSRPSSGNL